MTQDNYPPLLITSCIYVSDNFVRLSDPEKRVFHTLEAIGYWLKDFPTIKIVICDGSDYDFQNILTERFPSVEFECLHFHNDKEMVKKYGKGFGEGQIIEYALNNSSLLNKHPSFAKCTSKLWIRNFEECAKEFHQGILGKAHFKNVLSLNATQFEYFDTRFFITDKKYFEEFFLPSYQTLTTISGQSIEHVFKDVILKNHLFPVLFRSTPQIYGMGGGNGNYYKNSYKRRLKESIRNHLIQKNPAFSELFNPNHI